MRTLARLVALAALLAGAAPVAASSDPALQRAMDGLLAADRQHATAAAAVDVVTALTAMFADDVIMPAAPGRFYRGIAEAREALRANPDNLDGRVAWTPVGGGIAADGQQGYTFGFMNVTTTAGTTPLKYMAYWARRAEGWRVVGYKRARRPEGDVKLTLMPLRVPAASRPVDADAARLDAHRRSLADAEKAFSDEAQRIGLGPAFAKHGADTAVNMGGPSSAGYVVGAAAIAATVGAGAPGATSPVEWSTETAIVASSGDLGISFGFIRPNARAADAAAAAPPPPAPFFTIWHRPSPTAAWEYIAE